MLAQIVQVLDYTEAGGSVIGLSELVVTQLLEELL